MSHDDQIRVRIPVEEKAATKRQARREGISLSELVRRLLREWRRGKIKTPRDEED